MTHKSNTHSLRTTSFSHLLLSYLNKKSNDFRTFSYVALFLRNRIPDTAFTLQPLTCHLEETSKLIYSTKPFLLQLSSISDKLSGFDCFMLWLSSLDKLASNLSLLGELATCKSNFYY